VTDAFSARAPLRLAGYVIVVFAFGFGGWAIGTRISGAVAAQGQIEIALHHHVVQHPDGGVVDAILIAEGDAVTAGQPLIRLDTAQFQSEVTVLETRHFEILARQARLRAERDGTDLAFPGNLQAAARTRSDVLAQMEGQASLLQARRETLDGITAQLLRRRVQIAAQITGLSAQLEALERQRHLVATERSTQAELVQRGLSQTARLSALDRDAARLDGEYGALLAERAAAAERDTETAQQILSLIVQHREEAERELREISAQELELAERLRALRAQIDRMTLRAPADGVVHGLQVTTLRAVLRPAEAALYIVPRDSPLIVVARLAPSAILQVWHGQQAVIMLSGNSGRKIPQIIANVVQISADAFTDANSGISQYKVELALDPHSAAISDTALLAPGMPVDVFFQTEMRRPISYLTQPLTYFFARALRDG